MPTRGGMSWSLASKGSLRSRFDAGASPTVRALTTPGSGAIPSNSSSRHVPKPQSKGRSKSMTRVSRVVTTFAFVALFATVLAATPAWQDVEGVFGTKIWR